MRKSDFLILALLSISMVGCSNGPSTREVAAEKAVTPTAVENPSKTMAKFVVELDRKTDVKPGADDGVEKLEVFVTANKAYAMYAAENMGDLVKYFERAGVSAKKMIEVRDINSPTRGGGQPPGQQPRQGHKTFVIERRVLGVGTFPEEKKEAISKASNAAVARIGDSIEWDHSYLTDEGTYCVYRATDEETIRNHAKIAGVPVNVVSEVQEFIPAP